MEPFNSESLLAIGLWQADSDRNHYCLEAVQLSPRCQRHGSLHLALVRQMSRSHKTHPDQQPVSLSPQGTVKCSYLCKTEEKNAVSGVVHWQNALNALSSSYQKIRLFGNKYYSLLQLCIVVDSKELQCTSVSLIFTQSI